MFTEATGPHGRTYRLTTQYKNSGTPLERVEFVVHEVSPEGGLVDGRYFSKRARAFAHFFAKLGK